MTCFKDVKIKTVCQHGTFISNLCEKEKMEEIRILIFIEAMEIYQ